MTTDIVAILHAGSEEDIAITIQVEHFLKQNGHRKAEYQRKIEPREAAKDVYKNLNSYAKSNLPIVVVITRYFLTEIWLSTLKPSILCGITRYKNKACVHVLAPSVDIKTILRYSSCIANGALKIVTPYFRTVWLERLEFLTSTDAGEELVTLLTSFPKYDLKSYNYAVASSRTSPEAHECELNIKSGSKQLVESLSSASFAESSCLTGSPSITKKARPILLSNTFNKYPRHMFELSKFLDTPGSDICNYKSLAAKFDFNKDEIEKFTSLTGYGEKPAFHVLQSIINRFPDLTVEMFEKVLSDLEGYDAVKYIQGKMYKK